MMQHWSDVIGASASRAWPEAAEVHVVQRSTSVVGMCNVETSGAATGMSQSGHHGSPAQLLRVLSHWVQISDTQLMGQRASRGRGVLVGCRQ